MNALTITLLALGGFLILAHRRASLGTWTSVTAAALALLHFFGTGLSSLTWLLFIAAAAVLNIKPVRRHLFSAPLLGWFRRLLPPMSDTEKAAIDAGTVWWDAELFTGRPDWDRMLKSPAPVLSAEEKAFLDGPTDELCRMLDEWEIENDVNDLPEDVWDFIKQNRFFWYETHLL